MSDQRDRVGTHMLQIKVIRSVLDCARRIENAGFAAWNSRVDRRISMAVGTTLIVLGLGDVTAKVHVRPGFYGAVAQILPVLLLAIVVEGRYFRRLDQRESFDRFLLRGLLFVPLLGEGASLACVAQGHDTVWLRGTVLFALGVVVLLIVLYAAYGPADDRVGRAATIAAAVQGVKEGSTGK